MAPLTGGPGRQRRTPQQDRSRVMVRRILAAARVVLVSSGYSAASTNKIAAAAGISPGSLYQYFSDKDAIVAAVVKEYSEQVADRIAGVLMERMGRMTGSQSTKAALEATLDVLSERPELLRVLVEHTARLGLEDRVLAFEERIGDIISAHLRTGAWPPTKNIYVRSWMNARVVENLAIRYILDRPEIEREEFLDVLTELIVGYPTGSGG